MEEILNLIVPYQAAITAIATIFIAGSAMVTTILTRKLARENELLRKAGTEPEVIAYLDIGSYFINFVLANVGQGPAQKVQFSIKSDDFRFRDPQYEKIFLRNDAERTAISFLPQDENIRVAFCFDRILFYEKTVKLDIAQFLGFASPPPRQIETDLVKVLEKIEKHFQKVSSSDRLRVETMTNKEVEQKLKRIADQWVGKPVEDPQ